MLAGLGWAQPAKKVAMVLQVQGKVASNSSPVLTGQLWSSRDHIELGARVTVLLIKARLLLDLGHYADAPQTLQAANPLKPIVQMFAWNRFFAQITRSAQVRGVQIARCYMLTSL